MAVRKQHRRDWEFTHHVKSRKKKKKKKAGSTGANHQYQQTLITNQFHIVSSKQNRNNVSKRNTPNQTRCKQQDVRKHVKIKKKPRTERIRTGIQPTRTKKFVQTNFHGIVVPTDYGKTFGHSKALKQQNWIRCGSQNVYSIPATKWHVKSRQVVQTLTHPQANDVNLFQEHNLYPPKIKLEDSWKYRIGKHKIKSIFSYVSRTKREIKIKIDNAEN